MKENKKTTYQNLGHTHKLMLRGKLIAVIPILKKILPQACQNGYHPKDNNK